jgi:hypothetical protein
MPSRILREGINSSARILALSPGAEILYRRLMSVVDDYGRYHAAPQTVLAGCWPTMPDKVCLQDVSNWLTECTQGARPLLTLYTHDGATYLQVTDFNQTIRTKSKFPQPVNNLQAGCEQSVGAIRSSEFGVRDSSIVVRGEPPPPPKPAFEINPHVEQELTGHDLVEGTLNNIRQQYDDAGFLVGDLATSRAKLGQILSVAVHPIRAAEAIQRSLAAHIVHWRVSGYPKKLMYWLRDEEYKSTPAPPATNAPEAKKPNRGIDPMQSKLTDKDIKYVER